MFNIFLSFNSHFYFTLIAANVGDFQGSCKIVREQFFLQKNTFSKFEELQLYAVALKFSANQINLITKKSVSAICEIMNINEDFRIFVNTNHSVFLKKHTKTQIKLKLNFFGKSGTHFCRECYDLDMCQNLEKTINVW